MSKDDTIPASDGAIQVHAIHHASLILTWNGKHIFVDPAPLEDKGNAVPQYKAMPKPDVILYTHSHYDHYNAGILEAIAAPSTQILAPQEVAVEIPKSLQAQVHVLANGDKTKVDGIPVEVVPMYNTTPERSKFHPKGKGNGYILTLGGDRIYIAGDTEEAPELAHLSNIDAAFIPMNIPYTETIESAAKWVRDFKPHIVYPYHYRNGDGTVSDMAAFTKDVGGASQVRVLEWY